ncbi:aladin-like [Drosophila obscura]|uniref:aladin-like n=1 Tax=Drosophila obscura TaxID=7282 RepID=UPI001BB1A937|nr:aladin-like [Drosophila obscura]
MSNVSDIYAVSHLDGSASEGADNEEEFYEYYDLWVRYLLGAKANLKDRTLTLAIYHQTPIWKATRFRFVVCHASPTGNMQVALITVGDIVLVYDGLDQSVPFELQDSWQEHITCAAFRPSGTVMLAVGCAEGLCIWEKNSDQMRLLSATGHKYVTSLTWSKNGAHLVSAAVSTHHIVIWDMDKKNFVRFVPGPGGLLTCYHQLLFSPDFQLLLCADNNSRASICQMNQSGNQDLNRKDVKRDLLLMKATIHAAAWATIGDCQYLLFAHERDSKLYALTCKKEDGLWIQCVLSDLEAHPEQFIVSPQNNLLVIKFKKKNFVKLYKLVPCENLPPKIIPLLCYYSTIDGRAERDENIFAECVAFGEDDSPEDPLLVIAWSSGSLHHIKLLPSTEEESLHS